ncbi:hypothetical protein D9V96_018735 [Zobellia laminariae]|uniref:hypothetical protein n=1 Tax=Zobellia laminariae TaxID=248906 RepID=UPI0012D85E45|nr:hypothetical protein [Zobellia laminariae]MUH40573.1 hypothetical protein [Zobellia laminariae]WKX75818.1 hypothetical protein Q5W13_19815 [Zobellia laminariae]
MTTTTQRRSLRVEENDKNAIVVRLQRNQKDLVQLRTKLNSYRCEPKTHSLFERIESLRSKMDSLSHSNNEIISSLNSKRKIVGVQLDRAKRHLTEFRRLNEGVEEYLNICTGQQSAFF